MENNFINSRTNRFDVSATHIRYVEKTLQDFIKRLNKQNVNTKIEGVGTACENIKQKILEHEDDTQLSVVHNICRKIHIAIELMLKVSIVFGNSVDFQIRNIVHALLNMEKLRLISKEILKNQRVTFLEEQFFSHAAQEKLWNQNDASKQKELVANNEEISYRNQQSLLKMLVQITCLSPEYELCCANNEKSKQEKSHSQNDSLHLISNKDDESRPQIKVMNKEWEEQEDEFDSDLPWCLDEFKPVKIGTGRKKKIPLIIDRKTIINNYSTRAISLNEKIKVGRVKVYEGPPRILEAMSSTHLMSYPGFLSRFSHHSNPKISLLYKRHLIAEPKEHQPFQKGYKVRKILHSPETKIVVQDAGRVGQVVSNSAGAKIVNLLDEAGTKSTVLDEHILLTAAKRCGRPTGASVSEHFQQPSDNILPPPDKIPRRTDEMKTSISEVRDLYSIAKPVTPNFLTLPEMDCFQPIHPQPQDTLLLDNDWMFRKAMEQTKVLSNNSEEINRLREQPHEEIQTLMKSLPPRDSSPWQDQPLPKPHSKKWCNFDYVMQEIKLIWAVSKTVEPEKEIKAKDILALEGGLSINNYLTLIRILDKLALRKRLYLKMKKGELTIRPIDPSFGSFTEDRTATDTRNFIY